MSYILAGDIGGTKTTLAVYELRHQQRVEVAKQTFVSGQHHTFIELVSEFLAPLAFKISAAAFGIAGPVKQQRCETTNLPWVIDAHEIAQRFDIATVQLLNDLEAAAYGVLELEVFHDLNHKAVPQAGHIAVIAAGTGLGEAILFFDGQMHHAMPTEGGHCEFAPQDSLQDQLLVYLRARFAGHVSLERILSGDGFGTLYDFLKSIDYAPVNSELEAKMAVGDRNAVISLAGLHGSDVLCEKVMALFCSIYGAEAGNLALKTLPLGGVYIAGGIAPKIRAALESGLFMHSFLDKGRLSHAIETIPVRIVEDPEAPLLGAAHCAKGLLN